MMNLSTLLFLVNTEPGNEEDSHLVEEINLMEKIDTEPLFKAPEAAVRKVLGFAAACSTMKTSSIEEFEIIKN